MLKERSMLMDLLYALPLIFFATFGLYHTSELGFLIGANEQASFFAARSEFVGADNAKSVDYFSKVIFDPIALYRDRPREVDVASFTLHLEQNAERIIAETEIEYPELFPHGGHFFKSPPLLQAFTLVPVRDKS